MAVQVLGSGGPETQDKRASTSYLIWKDGKARVILDAGGGSALRFGESGAQMSTLDVFLFSHFHVDHTSDFPALVFSSWFEDRNRPLPVYGPPGNEFMPSTTEFVHDLFSDPHGAWRYLSELVDSGNDSSYKLQPHDVAAGSTPLPVFHNADMSISAVRVIHGASPRSPGASKSAASESSSAETPTAKATASPSSPRTPIYSSLITPCRKAQPESNGACTCRRP